MSPAFPGRALRDHEVMKPLPDSPLPGRLEEVRGNRSRRRAQLGDQVRKPSRVGRLDERANEPTVLPRESVGRHSLGIKPGQTAHPSFEVEIETEIEPDPFETCPFRRGAAMARRAAPGDSRRSAA